MTKYSTNISYWNNRFTEKVKTNRHNYSLSYDFTTMAKIGLKDKFLKNTKDNMKIHSGKIMS